VTPEAIETRLKKSILTRIQESLCLQDLSRATLLGSIAGLFMVLLIPRESFGREWPRNLTLSITNVETSLHAHNNTDSTTETIVLYFSGNGSIYSNFGSANGSNSPVGVIIPPGRHEGRYSQVGRIQGEAMTFSDFVNIEGSLPAITVLVATRVCEIPDDRGCFNHNRQFALNISDNGCAVVSANSTVQDHLPGALNPTIAVTTGPKSVGLCRAEI
jgi:hypothetical protein